MSTAQAYIFKDFAPEKAGEHAFFSSFARHETNQNEDGFFTLMIPSLHRNFFEG